MQRRTNNSAVPNRYRHDGPGSPSRRPPALTPSPARAAAPASHFATSAAPHVAQTSLVDAPVRPNLEPRLQAAYQVSPAQTVPRPKGRMPSAASPLQAMPVAVATAAPAVRRSPVELPPVVLRLPEIQPDTVPATSMGMRQWATDERMLILAIAFGVVLLSLLFFSRRSATDDPGTPLPGENIAPAWKAESASANTLPPAPAWKEPIAVTPPLVETPTARGVPSTPNTADVADPTRGLVRGPSLDAPYPTDPSGEAAIGPMIPGHVAEAGAAMDQGVAQDDLQNRVGDRYRDYRTADARDGQLVSPGDFERRDTTPSNPAVRLDGTIEKHLPGSRYDRP